MKTLDLSHFIVSIVVVLISVGGIAVTTGARIEQMETRIDMLEHEYEKTQSKLDKLIDAVHSIDLQLQRKQDKE
jgi:prefoldin subunit 5